MCNLSEGVKEERWQEAKIDCAKEHVYNVMKGLGITFDETVKILKVDKDIAEIIKKDIMAQ